MSITIFMSLILFLLGTYFGTVTIRDSMRPWEKALDEIVPEAAAVVKKNGHRRASDPNILGAMGLPTPGTAELLEQVRELEESLAQQRRRTQQAQHRLAETEEQLQLQQMRQQHAQSPRSAGASRSASRSALAPAPAVLDEVRPHPRSRPYPHPGSV